MTLTAREHALGNTTNLIVDGSYTNAGANAVNLLNVAAGGSLTLDADGERARKDLSSLREGGAQ